MHVYKKIKYIWSHHRSIVLIVILSTLLYFVIGFSFEATGDMGGWVNGGSLAASGVNYSQCGDQCYNWPPLTYHYFQTMSYLETTHNWLHLPKWGFYKILSLLASIGILIAMYAILRIKKVKKAALYTALYAFNPITIYVSAYHGQRDPIWLLGVLSAVLAVLKKRYVIAGIVFGLGAAVKIPALFLIPFFFFSIPNKHRFRFLYSLGATFIAVNLPEIIIYPHDVFERVFQYPGWIGWWGLSGIITRIVENNGLEAYAALADQLNKFLLYGAIVGASFYFAKKKVGMVTGLFFVTMVVFVFSHAFASQYTLWALPFITILFATDSKKYKVPYVVYVILSFIITINFYGVIGIPVLEYLLLSVPQKLFYAIDWFKYPMDIAYPLWFFSIVVVTLFVKRLKSSKSEASV